MKDKELDEYKNIVRLIKSKDENNIILGFTMAKALNYDIVDIFYDVARGSNFRYYSFKINHKELCIFKDAIYIVGFSKYDCVNTYNKTTHKDKELMINKFLEALSI